MRKLSQLASNLLILATIDELYGSLYKKANDPITFGPSYAGFKPQKFSELMKGNDYRFGKEFEGRKRFGQEEMVSRSEAIRSMHGTREMRLPKSLDSYFKQSALGIRCA